MKTIKKATRTEKAKAVAELLGLWDAKVEARLTPLGVKVRLEGFERHLDERTEQVALLVRRLGDGKLEAFVHTLCGLLRENFFGVSPYRLAIMLAVASPTEVVDALLVTCQKFKP